MATALGVTIGRQSATLALVSRRGGSLSLDRYLYFSLRDLKDEGIDIERPDRIVSALVNRMHERRLKRFPIALGVSGRDAIIRYTHLPPMPPWRQKLIMQYEIKDASEKSASPLSADYRPLGAGSEGTCVLVAMAKDDRVLEWVRAFQAAKLEVVSASPLPVALGNTYRFLGDEANQGMTLVLDVGRTSTEVALLEEGRLAFARSVAAGGDLLTERIMKAFDLGHDAAEKVKRAGRGPGGESLAPILAPGTQKLASLVKATLDFARQQLKQDALYIHRVAVAGGAARAEGVVAALGASASARATLFNPIEAIDTSSLSAEDRDDADAHPHEAASAIGLALGRVVPTAIELDLLPNSTKAARTFRHRTVFMVAAAVLLFVSVALGLGSTGLRLSKERERALELKRDTVQVDQRLETVRTLEEANTARARTVAGLAFRARPGYHLASLLALLGRELPKKASVVELALDHDRDGNGFKLDVRGQADNAQRDALETLKKLEAALSRDPDVANAKVEATSGVGGPIVEWRLVVVPNAPVPPAPAADGKGS